MGKIRIYTNESVPVAIAEGLRRRGVDAQSANDAGNYGLTDEQQLNYAGKKGFVIFTHDDDFLAMARRMTHSGIIFAHQKDNNTGECIRRIKIIVDILAPEDMKDHIEFL